jgi:photoactive yellow protein
MGRSAQTACTGQVLTGSAKGVIYDGLAAAIGLCVGLRPLLTWRITAMQTDALAFDQPDLLPALHALDADHADTLPFGVIGFGADGLVNRYNATECEAAGLGMQRVMGLPLFTVVAPCMNNYMVAQRFEEAVSGGAALDATLPYVLTLRMKPTSVRLRLLADPSLATRYVLVERGA